MTDYYMGILVGGAMGYCIALVSLVAVWSLCMIAGQEEGREYGKTDVDKKQH